MSTTTSNIPAEMAALPQWVCADRDKIPHSPRSGNRASPTNPTDWATLEVAAPAATRRGHRLGFCLTSRDPFVLVDLDKCRDPLTGTLDPWATDILARFPGTYAEISVSGTGIHIIGMMSHPLPAGRRKGPRVEIYDDGRYVVMTGHVLPGHERLGDITADVVALHAETFPPAPPRQPQSVRVASSGGDDLEDTELIDRARGARNGAKFDRLWGGDLSGHAGDESAADLALLSMLAFWTSDPDQLDRVFRLSGLYRDKWERGDYRSRTIARALERSECYTAPARRTVRPNTQDATLVAGAPVATVTDADPAGSGACQLEVLGLRRKLAEVERERDAARAALSMAIQTALNPNLSATEKVAVFALNGIVQHKRDTGQLEPDGTVVVSAAEVADDWRKAPAPGERVAPHNQSGTLPRMARDRVKPLVAAAVERGLVSATPRTVVRTGPGGTAYRETTWAVAPVSTAEFLAPAATWRPEEPVARKPRRIAVPCSSCDEVHPIIRTDVCGGCGTIRDRRTIEPGDDLGVATPPTLPASDNLSDIGAPPPACGPSTTFSDNLSEVPGTHPAGWSALPAHPGSPGTIAHERQTGGGASPSAVPPLDPYTDVAWGRSRP